MSTFTENQIVTVYCWDLETGIYTETKEYKAEKGLGLPAGMTIDEVVSISGKVAIRDVDRDQWVHVDDDRGRIFYDKQNGQAFETTILGETVDRRSYTKIAPPAVAEDQLVKFDDSQQSWLIGFDWYELPVWDSQQKKSFYTGDFFIPDSSATNIEPTAEQEGYTLNNSGEWVEPEVEPEAVPEVEPEAVPEVEPEAVPEVEPEAVPEAVPEETKETE